MSPSSRGRGGRLLPRNSGSSMARWMATGASLCLLLLALCRQAGSQTLELKTQLPTVSLISNIAGYGWQPGFPCNQIAPAAISCDSAGYVTSLNLPATTGAYLPEAIGNLTRLTSLIIQNNYYSDVLPQSIGKLVLLRNLVLTGNMFSGSLPASMSSLTALSNLNLAQNLFTGPVPPGLQSLASLVQVDLSFNFFSGPVSFAAPSCASVVLTKNCLSSSSKCASQAGQRSTGECAAACGARVWQSTSSSVCSGLGLCLPSGSLTAGVPTDWACLCNNNYKKGAGFSCIPIPSPPPPRPPPPRPPRPPPRPPPPCGGPCPPYARCLYLKTPARMVCKCWASGTEDVYVGGKLTCQKCTTVNKKKVCRPP